AQGTRGQRDHAQNSLTRRQLDDVESLGNRSAGFRHYVQGVPRGSAQRRSSLWRTAPLYSGTGEFLWSARGGSADPEYAARGRQVPLRSEPDVPGVVRYSDDSFSAEIFYAADALFWQHRSGGHCFGRSDAG